MIYFFTFKNFIYAFAAGVTERGGESERTLSASSVPKLLQCLEISCTESKSQELLLSLPCRCREPRIRAVLTAVSGVLGTILEVKPLGLKLVSIYDASTTDNGFLCYVTALAPVIHLLVIIIVMDCRHMQVLKKKAWKI